MKAKLFIIWDAEKGKYIIRAEGSGVKTPILEVDYYGMEGDYDLFHNPLQNRGRYLGISANELSWLSDGKEYEIKEWKFIQK